MRVGHFVSYDGVEAGMESRVSGHVKVPLLVIEAQRRAGVDVELITTSIMPGKTLGMDLDAEVPRHELGFNRSGRAQWRQAIVLVAQLIRLSHRRSYDVVHVWGFSRHAEMAGLARLLGVGAPVVVTMFAPPGYSPTGLRRILWSHIDAIVASTDHTRLALASMGLEVSLVRHGSTRDLRGEATSPAGSAPRRRVLFWREMTRANGGDIAVEAFRRLAQRHPTVLFTFAIRPSGEVEVEQAQAWGDNVEVIRAPYPDGFSLGDLVAESFCVVLPFRWLSMNPQLAIIESLAAGVPVVTTDIASNGEFVLTTETGTLVPVDDVDAVVRAVDDLLADPDQAERMGSLAATRMRRWHWGGYSDQLVEIYEDVIEPGAR